MKVKPIKDRVLIKQLNSKDNVGGFMLSVDSQKKPMRGEVVAIGESVSMCKVGDIVDYNEYGATTHEINGIEYILVREETDILLIN